MGLGVWFFLLIVAYLIFVKFPLWVAQEHQLAVKYRELVRLAKEMPAAQQGGWKIVYKEGRKNKEFVSTAKTETDAMRQFTAQRIRYDSIVSMERK